METVQKTPGASPETTPTRPAPIWTLLGGDLHMQMLRPDYAPTGLLEMIASPPARVLDVGCFCGGTGRWLKQRFPGVEVIGIECLAPAAARARETYERVIEAPIEAVDFEAQGLAPGSVDAIVAADVLEHLVNPWAVLQRLRPLLTPKGALYVSLPNVRNLNLVAGLVSGEWRYVGAGILDVSHLRFFTRAQAIEMLAETGWRTQEIRINPDPKVMSFFGGKNLADVHSIDTPRLSLKNLTHADVLEWVALQFFFRASPG
jgi:2-polyprenyl-3-methyl-5-hydroxy-6-metoxy-1,4-benzoquinol methylase